MFVKICGITNEDDALFAVAMGADAVGFIFAPSQRQVAPQVVYDITRRLPPEVLTVGVFKDEHPSRVVEIANKSGVKAVQLHGRETIEQTREIAHNVRYVIKAFGADSPHLAKADQYGTDLVMVDSPGGGTGKLFDWNVVSDVPDSVRLILAGGLDPDNVASAIQAVEPWGVDVASGVELSPGKKDPSKVRRFIANARAAAPTPYLGPDDLPYDWADE
ncbi:MAG: phosphoribosylanthranilate isomerase [Ilumatobacter fluminis]|uniref:N-(5'-phosphoribosyl)anthranilate isomerase n=1 Tax=Ilumatobacter fluminis TaxID=467091 RepID=A0A4R7HZZ7_9ACTN|nr:phosphoribosylanthranilate isomerase [Ilumatobacter fluminis]TDT16705.1 phosphoribosylanthranilate isomerase [Ilumatobacter fluminis]